MEEIINNDPVNHPLQSFEWGEFRKSQGVRVVRFSNFQISFHLLPLLNLTVGYLPKGPFPNQEDLEKLKEIGREQKAIFIKMEPNVEKQNFKDTGFQKFGLTEGKPLFTKFTSVIDLTPLEEEIFNNFKPKTRYNIRLAEKHGVKVQEDNSKEAFEKYLELLFETTNRQGFFAHNKDYHRREWRILQPAGISHLLTATFKGKILSAFLLFVYNKTLYYPYGASTREHKELMAPTLLMWEAVKFGKRMGCLKFDLWGDTEANPPPNHPYFGFHKFKEGFSPKLVEFIGTYDLVINPIFYKIYQVIDFFRWKILRLKTKF